MTSYTVDLVSKTATQHEGGKRVDVAHNGDCLRQLWSGPRIWAR